MAEYTYDILLYQKEEGKDEEEVYRFTGAHSFVPNPNVDPIFTAELEHLEPIPNDPGRVRLKFTLKEPK